MVRGLFSKLCYPFPYFASTGFTSAQLYPRTIEATQILESIGYLIHAFVLDGAPPNRTFYKMMVQRDEDMFYTVSPFNRSRRIYFVSDVPHLLKTTRNCFENSCWNNQTRNLHVSTERLLQF